MCRVCSRAIAGVASVAAATSAIDKILVADIGVLHQEAEPMERGSPSQVRIATRCLKGALPHVLSTARERIREQVAGARLLATMLHNPDSLISVETGESVPIKSTEPSKASA